MQRATAMSSQKLREQAADVLRRARRLPIGSDRNDLRQLAIGLRWLAQRSSEGDIPVGVLATQAAGSSSAQSRKTG